MSGTPPPHVRLIRETPTMLQLAVTLSSGETAEETLTFQPNRQYTPTAEELTAQALQGRTVFGVKFTAAKGEGALSARLSYVVLTAALPASLRERLYGAASRTSGIHLFSAAWAQAGGALWTGLDVAVQMNQAYKAATGRFKPQWKKDLDQAYKSYQQIDQAFDASALHDKWMSQYDAMEECARNPTQTVTQNAYRDNPQYQQQTLDAISDARSETQQATALRYVNQDASIAMQLDAVQPFAQPVVTDAAGAVAKWNDAALQDIGNGLVSDTGKLVNCELARPPVRAAYNDGTITYHMHRRQFYDYDEEEETVEGPFLLQPGPGGTVTVSGEAAFRGRLVSTKSPSLTSSCEGRSTLEGGGADSALSGAGSFGTFWVGARPTVVKCAGTFQSGASESGFRCDFGRVDLVNGGDYEVQAQGEEAQWTVCTLHLKPSQKP